MPTRSLGAASLREGSWARGSRACIGTLSDVACRLRIIASILNSERALVHRILDTVPEAEALRGLSSDTAGALTVRRSAQRDWISAAGRASLGSACGPRHPQAPTKDSRATLPQHQDDPRAALSVCNSQLAAPKTVLSTARLQSCYLRRVQDTFRRIERAS
jgi:hypothetical protein